MENPALTIVVAVNRRKLIFLSVGAFGFERASRFPIL
jgi:hypothetical protein